MRHGHRRGARHAAWHILRRAAASGSFALLVGLAVPPAGAADYKLGPADRIHLRVVEFNRDTLTSTEWTVLAGDYRLDAGGTILLPIIGSVPASGLTVAELNSSIEARMRDLIGYETTANRPGQPAESALTASTEIVEYRPFYVSGTVEQPGAYAYRPNLTVLQAISIAGARPPMAGSDGWSLERDAINANGLIRNLNLEEITLLARQARLVAESQEAKQIDFSAVGTGALEKTAETKAIVERAKSVETAILEKRRAESKRQTDSYASQKELLENEVDSLLEQEKAQTLEGELIAKELKSVNSLVAQGLTTTSRKLALDRASAEIQSNVLELRTAAIQVRQDINRAERELAAFLDKRQNDIAADTRDVQAQLNSLAEKRRTGLALLNRLQAAGTVVAMDGLRQIYSIVRMGDDGQAVEIVDVAESEPVQPGDTIKVSLGIPGGNVSSISMDTTN